ncbi:hypothetical protein M409DRAFT_59172 [Zasmidium cellare ATCC 36951]|uniref:Extracellular membrane protein CFEM domain-containing protein n=1 Tax=Zasmidium cellare ATCC 36951 TaxID=1080233 RepID=A0A6A6C6G5_ZASCE|nr:uncharacterized protein M409DRAFT_59172 [Zasmidium cellare ATCC 36951]KAF2161472.1 hypothetical protein M409DRAFT_59172 [Zasmidium cellare ATCC 36951]
MHQSIIAITAILAAAFALDDCEVTYNQCVTSGQAEVKCSCDRTACYGEDAARIREWCASAIANLTTSTTTTPTSTSTTSQIIIITGTPGSQPQGQPPITAAEGSLLLGETCSDDRQCANGVECWGSHSGIIRRCGNFNAGCSNNTQCAYNTCNNGLCNGFLESSAMPALTQSQTLSNATWTSYPSASISQSANGTLPVLPTSS